MDQCNISQFWAINKECLDPNERLDPIKALRYLGVSLAVEAIFLNLSQDPFWFYAWATVSHPNPSVGGQLGHIRARCRREKYGSLLNELSVGQRIIISGSIKQIQPFVLTLDVAKIDRRVAEILVVPERRVAPKPKLDRTA